MKTSNQILYFKLKKNNHFFNNFSDLVSVSREFIIDQDSYSWMVLPLVPTGLYTYTYRPKYG
jgi:hypothetical protein